MKKIVLIGLFLFSKNLFAAEHGLVMVVKGIVKIESPGSLMTEAKVNSKVHVGDTIITENDSRAKIVMLADRNIINISPNTKLKIEKYTNSVADKNVKLNLIDGKVRAKVGEKYDNKNSKFEIRTATAVAGVRGTEFITSYNFLTKVTEVITMNGKVSFQSISNSGIGSQVEPVIIEKGEKSQIKEDGIVAPPIKVPEKEMKQIDSETTVKRKQREQGAGINPPPPGMNRGDDKSPPPPGASLVDMNSGNTQIIDGTATRKFDKSKVKIITQPSN